jgi:hypothetical protein
MTVKPFPMVEMAVKELVETYEPASGHTGGDLSYDGVGLYFWLALVPGGSADQIEGDWTLDIDVFAPSYAEAMTAALDLEAVLVGPRKVTSVLRLDNCYQNSGPSERPWDDENVYRIGAVYTFTARRPS